MHKQITKFAHYRRPIRGYVPSEANVYYATLIL